MNSSVDVNSINDVFNKILVSHVDKVFAGFELILV
jgi:hypothetical protein